PGWGGLAEARQRLAKVEKRVVTSSDPGGLSFLPGSSVPGFVADAFATSLRAKAVVANVIRTEPLPDSGLTVSTARFAIAPTVAVQTAENTAASQTDWDADTVTRPVCTIAGQPDMSTQLYERSSGGVIDIALARELGEALGTALDAQIVFGTGSAGQLRGLANVSGITSVTATNASPTAASNFARIGDLTAQHAAGYGSLADTLLIHPRRISFIRVK